MNNQFSIAADLLEYSHNTSITGIGSPVLTPNKAVEQATSLLRALGYLDDSPKRNLDNTDQNPTNILRKNRAALLRLAARCEDCFQLRLPHAKGAFAIGAMIDPEIFSIHDHPRIGANGCGLTFAKSFESCMGEVAEYLSFIERQNDPLLCKYDKTLLPDPDTLDWALQGIGLFNGSNPEELGWIQTRSLLDNKPMQFPSELVLRRPECNRTGTRPAESTGLGAGETYEDALLSGLLEVIERDAFALWWYGGNVASNISRQMDRCSSFQSIVETSNRSRGKNWWLIDITTGIGIPVCACLSSSKNGQQIVAGCAAGFSIADAASGAFLEMCQMELAQELSLSRVNKIAESKLNAVDKMWLDRHRHLSIDTFPDLLGRESAKKSNRQAVGRSVMQLAGMLKRKGFTIYSVDLSRPLVDIAVCKILIPKLQSSNKSWITDRLLKTMALNNRSPDQLMSKPSPI